MKNIIVEGHTDNVPINTYQFPSNWELSGARASRVVRFFTDEKDFAEIDFEPVWTCYNTTNNIYGKLKTLANMVNSF